MKEKVESIVRLYKEKKFAELKREIKSFEDDNFFGNVKALIFSNCIKVIGEKKEEKDIDLIEEKQAVQDKKEYLDLALFILDQNLDLKKQIVVDDVAYSLPYLAIMSGHVSIFDKMIKNGLDINNIENGANYLFYAISMGKQEIVNYLLENNIEIMPYKGHPSILNLAIVKYKTMPELPFKLIDIGYKFEMEHEKVENPIILALNYDQTLADKILESNYKFDLNSGSMLPLELFSYVSQNINDQFFEKIVLKVKQDLGSVDYKMKNTIPALHILIGKQELSKIEILLKNGVDVNNRAFFPKNSGLIGQETINGMTPIIYATYIGNEELVKMLVKFDANPNEKDLLGFTPLEVSAGTNSKVFLELMRSPKINLEENIASKGVLLQLKETEYVSAMHFLCGLKNSSTVDVLNQILEGKTEEELDKIYNLRTKSLDPSKDNFTLLMSACKNMQKDVILRLIKDKRANVNAANTYGDRAISILASNDVNNINEELMECIQSGALLEDELLKIKNKNKGDLLYTIRLLIVSGAETDFKVQNKQFLNLIPSDVKTVICDMTGESRNQIVRGFSRAMSSFRKCKR